ncbi:MAG: hypothetical protein Q9220_005406 [cf. Caloplaca sp. 1 TL-2023]
MGSTHHEGQREAENLHSDISQEDVLPAEGNTVARNSPQTTAPIEMIAIDDHPHIPASQTPQWPLRTDPPDQSPQLRSPNLGRNTHTETGLAAMSLPIIPLSREPPPITAADQGPSPTTGAPYPLTREKTAPAIGPSLEKPAPLPSESDVSGPCLLIMLLLITGSRHPFKMDEKYLKKRNINVEGNNPVNMSVYTLKELIWREWRDDEPVADHVPNRLGE